MKYQIELDSEEGIRIEDYINLISGATHACRVRDTTVIRDKADRLLTTCNIAKIDWHGLTEYSKPEPWVFGHVKDTARIHEGFWGYYRKEGLLYVCKNGGSLPTNRYTFIPGLPPATMEYRG